MKLIQTHIFFILLILSLDYSYFIISIQTDDITNLPLSNQRIYILISITICKNEDMNIYEFKKKFLKLILCILYIFRITLSDHNI